MSLANQVRLQMLLGWANRGRMAPDSPEARELDRLIKAKEANTDPAPEAPEAGPPMASVVGLTTVADQAAFYEVSRRTIMYWRKEGAPLRSPGDMVAWWGRRFPRESINPGILKALSKATPGAFPLPSPAPPLPAAAPPAPASPPAPPITLQEEEIGFDQTHRRMLVQEFRLAARIAALEEAGDLAAADVLRPAWLSLSTSLRAADTTHLKNAVQRGDLVPKALIEKEYASLIRHHPEVLRSGIRGMRLKLAPTVPAQVWDPLADALVNELFSALPALLLKAGAASLS